MWQSIHFTHAVGWGNRGALRAATSNLLGKETAVSELDDSDARGEPPLPIGYRQAVVTAIALFLSLSIAFLRFWSFEAPGSWTLASTGSAMLTAAGIVLLLIALFRALDIRDDALSHYRVTVRIFFAGILVVIIGATISSIVLAIETGSF